MNEKNSKKLSIPQKKAKISSKQSKILSISQIFKKYKSQDTYSITPKKFIIKKNPTEENLISQKQSKKNSRTNVSSLRITNPIHEPNSDNYCKTPSHANNCISSCFLSEGLGNIKFPFIKMMSDSSLQELDTEGNMNSIENENEEDIIIINEQKESTVTNDFYMSQINENTQQIEKDISNRIPNVLVNPFTLSNSDEERKNNVKIDDTSSPTQKISVESELECLQRKLLQTAKRGDKDKVANILQKILSNKKGDINYCDENNWTALHYASDEGCLKIVELLIKSNCDVNALTKNRKTALHLASSHGYFDISRLLIENGCLINQYDVEKNSPLHLCAFGGHEELLKFLLEKLPEADTKNIYGNTPLDLACNEEIKEIFRKYLLKKENQYHRVKIHHANDSNLSQMFNNIKMNRGGNNNININIQNNFCNHSLTNSNTQSTRTICKKLHIGEKVNVTIKTSMENEIAPKTTKNKQAMSSKFGFKNNVIHSKNISTTTGDKSNQFLKLNLNTEHNRKFSNNKKTTPKVEKNPRVIPSRTSREKPVTPNNIKKTNTNGYNGENSKVNSSNPLTAEINLEELKINPTSFICLALLGRGSFGEVYLVKKIDTNMLYAMKILSKSRIKSQNLFKYAMAERNVLSLTNHPFIVKLNFAFQTSNKLFLILDYCSNGDLSRHLIYEKRFSEERAKFYICEILLALEDLHQRGIIFRDLKPDNVVLDNEGHAKLTDFGLSKEGVYESDCAKSFCGSIAYLAPEMLKRSGHGKAVDWYLLGVLFYEMLVGIPPFFTDQR